MDIRRAWGFETFFHELLYREIMFAGDKTLPNVFIIAQMAFTLHVFSKR